jgi:type I restriction enzyme S subunit
MKLLELFKELTLHPKNAEELKGLILQLAVEGKLTKNWREEHPDVEPASVFLKNIEKEKANLIKEGIWKKEKAYGQVLDKQRILKTPQKWSWCKLGESGFTQTGNTPSKSKMEYFGNFIPFLGPADISNDWMKYPEEGLSQLGISVGRLIPAKSLMMVCIGGSIGKCNINEIDVSCNQQINCITPILSPAEYIKFVCQSPFFQKNVLSNSSGSATPIINKGKWENLAIPFPPLEEQKAIVEVVNQLFAEVEQLETLTKERIQLKGDFVVSALQRLSNGDTAKEWSFLQEHFKTFFTEKSNVKKLREAVLQLVVQGKLTTKWRLLRQAQQPLLEPASELLKRIKAEKEQLIKEKKIKKEKPLPTITEDEIPYDLPEGWVWCRLGSLVKSMTNGLYKPAQYYTDNGIVSLRMFNIQNGKIDFKGARKVEVTSSELTTYQLEENDLLINRVNSHELIGKTAIIPKHNEDLVYESMNIRTTLFFKDEISHYLNMFLQSEGARAYLMTSSKQAIGQASINQTIISSLLIPFPSIEEQKAIVEKVNALMDLCDALEQEITKNNTQVQDLMRSCLREVLEG